MKNNNILLAFLISLAALFCSCDSYLDKKEDQQLAFADVWAKRVTILQYYTNVWGHIPADQFLADNHPFVSTADDTDFGYERVYRQINLGTWSPSNIPYHGLLWPQFYKGIREANIFMNNVESSTAEDVTKEEIAQWKAEVQFARAYLYFLLFRTYGPFVIIGNNPLDANVSSFGQKRASLDECVEYLISELEDCATSLPDGYADTGDYGRANKGICYALMGRIQLYAARPLYNGCSLYADYKNTDGSNLFPTSPDQNKWKLAADANKRLIDFSDANSLYQLHVVKNSNGDIDPYESFAGVFLSDWNKELIFARWGDRWFIQGMLTPSVIGGVSPYGAVGPTQQQVDAYAMSSGRYPITGYTDRGATPIIDPLTNYKDNGFTDDFVHPIEKQPLRTFNMYVDREPRFYASVIWSGGRWPYLAGGKTPVFAYNGNSGPGPRHDYPRTGYVARKFVNTKINTGGGVGMGNITFPVIRLAEIYLNYAEALNEWQPSNPDILIYLNKVRERAGVPNIEEVYQEFKSLGEGTKLKMREMIQHERQVEFFFELSRYFDTRQWMTAPEVINGPKYGMNVMAVASNQNETPEDYWQRTIFETRIFKDAYYLYPLSENELSKAPGLVQNPFW